MTPRWLSPDCEVGKHTICDLIAWDDHRDVPTDCGCTCHHPGTSA